MSDEVTRIDVGPPVTVEVMPGVIVRPGDVLILQCDPVTLEQAKHIHDAVMEQLPGLADVIVFGGARIGGVYRDEAS
jgi:hypothetical protein